MGTQADCGMNEVTDPIYHGAADVLPDEHPQAWESLYCIKCSHMVHAFNNECMTGWFETTYGPICFECFTELPCRDDLPGPGSDCVHATLDDWCDNCDTTRSPLQ